jgi:putative transcriptional regulator
MRDALFQELVAGVREGMAILRSEAEPSRVFVVEAPDVRQIRNSYLLSQDEFASLIGIGVRTVREWELGRCAPRGPARVLLEIAARHPEAVRDVLENPPRAKQIARKTKPRVA